MNVGDFVVPNRPGFYLACGSGIYDRAVVVSVAPLVLVSEWGDMRWSATIKRADIRATGPAPAKIRKVAMARFYHDYPDRKPPPWWKRLLTLMKRVRSDG